MSPSGMLEWYGAMIGVYAAMPIAERRELLKWDENRPPGVATSDWPGFVKYIGPPPHGILGTPSTGYVKRVLSVPTKWVVWRRDNFTCKHCGSQLCLTVDHIVPESKGGSDELSNLQTLCHRCNCKKGSR